MILRPGITQLRDQAVADVLAVTGYPTLMRRSPLRGLAYGQAGLAHGQYGFLDWVLRQAVPWSATGLFLEAWAALVAITRLAGTSATGSVALTGTGMVPAATMLRRGDGLSFVTDADVTIAGAGTVTITAWQPGSAYTLETGDRLDFVSPVGGVATTGTATHNASGTDPELDAPLRTRMLQRYAAPPQVGAASDYLEWASAVDGVTRVWVNPFGDGSGTVVVYVMLDLAQAAHGGFPQGSDGVAAAETRATAATGDQATVANALYPLRPVTALVFVVSPISYPVNFALHPLATVPGAVLDAAKAAIDGVFLAQASPLGVELELSPFQAAVAQVPGMPDFTMSLPSGPITPPLGYLPVRGTVTLV